MLEGLFAPTHLLLILGIALIVFGPKRLPELGRALGESIRVFKKGFEEPPRVSEPPKRDEPPQPPA
jgi:sec-independent protein translocase protein TatA